MPHGDRPRSDELDIDVSFIHEFKMALLGVLQLFVGHLELAARSILGDGFGEKLPKRSWSGHMTVNIDDFVTVVHKTSC
jgi:hypothetical protein